MELVNDQVDTKIYVKEMGISVFRKFPYTSLFFNDVTVWSGHGFNRSDFSEISADTLFTAENVFLQFNIIDLARKKYNIKNMEARNGVIRILTDSNGDGNYNISSSAKDSPDSFFFDLSSVNIKNFDVKYTNMAKALDVNLLLKNIQMEGNFSRVNYRLEANGNAYIYSVSNHGIQYLSNQTFNTDVSLLVKNNVFSVSKGEMELGTLMADINGEFMISKEGTADLNLKLTGQKVDIAWLLNILKKNGLTAVDKISGSGKIDLTAEISGLASSKIAPHIQTSFITHGATVNFQDIGHPIKSLDITGSYNNGIQNSGSTSKLEISSFHALVSDSEISGSLAIQNFLLPRFTLSLQGELELGDLSLLIPALPLNDVQGKVSSDIQVNGLITGIGIGKPGISFIPQGSVTIHNAGLTLKNGNIEFASLNGELDIGSSQWHSSLSGTAGVSDFEIRTSSTNPLDYFLNDEQLDVNASLHSSSSNIDDLLKGFKKKQNKKLTIKYPENITARLAFYFNNINKGTIDAKNLSGVAHYSLPTCFVDSIHAEAMNGIIDGKIGLYNINLEQSFAKVSTDIEKVDINKLFLVFNNFRQEFLTNENIKGKLSGNADFSVPVNPDFSIESSKIIFESNIKIEDGELKDFEPMVAMSKFLKIDKMDHISFSTIENSIMIRDNSIVIPEMQIQSSALNLSASGTHSFDKTYKYHLSVLLSEYLFKKAQSSAKKEFEVALDENDRRTLFLLLYDEGKGIEVEFDEEQAIKKIKNNLREERNVLKVILNEEFGVFEDDNAVRENAERDESPMFKFEFTDEVASDSTKTKEDVKTKWWQKKKENKKKVDFVIEHDLIP